MLHYTYKTKGTCSKEISFDIENNIIHNVSFTFGCAGNSKGISALIEGMDVDKAIEILEGTDCNGRGTSCPDQLAQALKQTK